MKEDFIEISKPVGLLRRFGAIVYDGFLLFAVLFFASLPIVLGLGITYEHPFYLVYVIYIYMVAFVFFGWFWTQDGQTLGMKTWHIQIRQNNGELINWKQALLRYSSVLLFWIPAAVGYFLFSTSNLHRVLLLGLVPIAADYLACVFDPERRALHDMISRTRLVLINSKTR